MGITFVINTGRSFVYRVGPTKSWLVMCHIVISMEKPVFMEIVRNPKDAPVILAGKNPLKFIYSEKATKFCEISTLDLSTT